MGTTYGIPCGNTVAVVGDPGTGKTTLLLSYLTCAAIKGEVRKGVLTFCASSDDDKSDAFDTLNKLFIPAANPGSGKNSSLPKTLRCFVSLENNLNRVLRNHGALLGHWASSKYEESDQFVFIDATAFLSGRLEDKLRYPRLNGGNGNDLGDPWKDQVFDFTLGGHHLDDEDHFGLYFQENHDQRPVRIEELESWDNQGQSSNGEGGSHPFSGKKSPRAYNLITRPIADPMKRVRLLKDLLAELFVRFADYDRRILAIDSLSALMNPFDEEARDRSGPTGRRLHILNLVRWLEEYNVTTFMACEAEHDSIKTWSGHPLFLGKEERYLASGVIQLHYHTYPSGDIVRYLRVMKMRGAAHDMRPFAYGLDKGGIAWVEHLFGEAGNMR